MRSVLAAKTGFMAPLADHTRRPGIVLSIEQQQFHTESFAREKAEIDAVFTNCGAYRVALPEILSRIDVWAITHMGHGSPP
jgi:hypothetical protein